MVFKWKCNLYEAETGTTGRMLCVEMRRRNGTAENIQSMQKLAL